MIKLSELKAKQVNVLIKDILLVLFIQLLYVPTFTLRTIFLVKGWKIKAAAFGFIETIVYVFGLSIVLTGDKEPIVMIVYAIGFAFGIIVGSIIEEKLAIGFTTFQVILPTKNTALIKALREQGYGVTVYEGEGIEEKRYQLSVLTTRKKENDLYNFIQVQEPRAFIVAYEPKAFRGGFILRSMKKRKNKKQSS